MKFSEINEANYAVVLDNTNDPEVEIAGFGVLKLSQLKKNIQNKLSDLTRLFDQNPESLSKELESGTLPHFIKAYIEAQSQISPEIKTESFAAVLKHLKEGVPFCDSVFRYQSDAYFETLNTARALYRAGLIENLDWESAELLESDIGERVKIKGIGEVYLDTPYVEEAGEDPDPVDTVTVDVPLMIRMLEYAREDAKTDMDLHNVADAMIELSKSGTLTMDDYDQIVGSDQSQHELDEARGDIRKGLGVAALIAALGMSMPSANDTPLGKAMAKAAAAGDPVAAKHLDNLDFYADNNSAMLIKLSNKYLKGQDVQIPEAEYQGKSVELNKPKRGGSKKFYVYVKNPKTGKIKKVSFGAKSGGGNLAVKLKDPKARKAFADRHNCEQKKDKTSAGYWSCRLPRYAKSLGLSGGGTWW